MHAFGELFNCVLYFDKNYTMALRRLIERRIKNNFDFRNSHMVLRMNITDGRKSAIMKNQILKVYQQFLSDYSHNKLTEYVTDINGDSIKFLQYNVASHNEDCEYPIYGRFMNSGLIVILAFFVHGVIAVRLQQVEAEDCYYDEWMAYLARLVVQIPIAVVVSAVTALNMHVLYDVVSSRLCYVFLCLLLESVCGIHIGYILCSVFKNHFNVTIILYFKFTICTYVSGLWWPTCDLFGWKNLVISHFPISAGFCFIRLLIEKQYFVPKSLIIILCWSIILVIITVFDIATTKNEKRYNKLKNLL